MPASHCFRVVGQAFQRFGENGKSAVKCEGLGFGGLGVGIWDVKFGVWGFKFEVYLSFRPLPSIDSSSDVWV